MTENWVSFPNLGINFSVDPIAFSLGGFEVSWKYIFAVFAAAIALVIYLDYAKSYKLSRFGTLLSFAVAGVFGFFGARLIGTLVYEMKFRYVMLSDYGMTATWYYGEGGWDRFWWLDDGNFTVFGGFLLGIIALLVMCKIMSKSARGGIKQADMFDAAAMSLPLAQAVYSISNIFTQTRFGHNSNSLLAMDGSIVQEKVLDMHTNSGATVGMFTEWKVGQPVSPNFLIEVFGLVALYFVLKHFPKKWIMFRGQCAMMYAFGYSLIRALTEIGINVNDALYIYRFNVNMGLAIICAAVMTVLVVIFCIKCRGGGMEKLSLYVDKRTNNGFEDTELWQREYVGKQDETDDKPEDKPEATAEPVTDVAAPEADDDFVQTEGDGTVWSAEEESEEEKTEEDKNGDKN